MSVISFHRKQLFKFGLPYVIFIGEQPVGIMKGREGYVQLPGGTYDVSVRIMMGLYKWIFYIGGSRKVTIGEYEHVQLSITDKERWWNMIFNIDLVMWIVRLFITLPSPWDIVYDVISNGTFIIWLLRIWIIRKHYFQLEIAK